MYIKIHKSYRNVIAICDEDLIGKKFEEGIKILDCRESFYKDDSYTEKEAIKFLKHQSKEDSTFNIVGKNSINAALEAGIIKKEGILEIAGIPYALVLL
jgi:uncharacterized protein